MQSHTYALFLGWAGPRGHAQLRGKLNSVIPRRGLRILLKPKDGGCVSPFGLGNLRTTEIYCSQFWRLGTSTSQALAWVEWGRASWFIGSTVALCPRGGRGEKALWGLFNDGTNPIRKGSTFMT